MKKGFAFAGNLIIDNIFGIDGYPQKGMLSNIHTIERCTGGCAANTAMDISAIDSSIPIAVYGAVGDDENGAYILNMLESHHIDVRNVCILKNVPTSFTHVMTEESGGVRTFFHARGANAHFDMKHIDFALMQEEYFHIGYALLLDKFDDSDSEYGTVMAKTLASAKRSGKKTSMDVVSESGTRFKQVVIPSLKYCDYVIINEVEASMITEIPVRENGILDTNNLRKACLKIMDCGVEQMVVIHAPEGACAVDRGRRFVFAPSLELPKDYIRGTVGAGDAFCAGMLYSIFQGLDIEQSLLIGAGAAALCLSHMNAVDGMGSLDDIKNIINAYGRFHIGS